MYPKNISIYYEGYRISVNNELDIVPLSYNFLKTYFTSILIMPLILYKVEVKVV